MLYILLKNKMGQQVKCTSGNVGNIFIKSLLLPNIKPKKYKTEKTTEN